jgi:hypothetical protein
MTATLQPGTLRTRLETEVVVVVSNDLWEQDGHTFPEVERHVTGVAGDLVIVRVDDVLAAVEAPTPHERVIRRLGGAADVAAFVTRRLAQYERMWEGCGCKVDYYD